MNLRTKLWLLLGCGLLLPLLLMCVGGYWYFSGKLRSEALAYQQDMVNTLIANTHSELEHIKAAAAQIAVDELLARYLSMDADPRAQAVQSDVLKRFSNLQKINSNITLVQLLDTAGDIDTAFTASQNTTLGEGYFKRYFSSVPAINQLNGKGLADMQPLLRIHNVGFDGNRLLVLAPIVRTSNLSTENFQHLGWILVASDMSVFQRMMSARAINNSHFFFSDEFGSVLTTSLGVPFSSLPTTQMKHFENGTAGESFIRLELSGNPYFLNMRPVGDYFWLGSLVDLKGIFAATLRFLWVMLPALSLCLLMVGGVFYVQLNRQLMKPIDALMKAVKDVSRGNFSPSIDIQSHDEFGELKTAFSSMGKQLRESSEHITRLAYYDTLTKLPNRATLKNLLQKQIDLADKHSEKLAVLFIDLDDFKKINDRLGHEAGDELLVEVAQRLERCLRTTDVLIDSHDMSMQEDSPLQEGQLLVSRRGGDEFNVILTRIKRPREAAVVAERIIQDINQPIFLLGSAINVGASVGVAFYPDDGADVDALLSNADLAMYEAKQQGKNNYHLFTEALDRQIHARLELEQRMQRGLGRDEFELHYQPKLSLQNMLVVGFEALIRWHPSEGESVSPAEFIPVAEESALIFDLGNWVLAEALHQLQVWEQEGLLAQAMRIAVNISARQLEQDNFVDHLESLLKHFEVSPDRLELEITETSVLSDEASVRLHLERLSVIGVHISLDDFGTGYSSLNFLRELPIDVVKIDRSFIANLSRDAETSTITYSLLELCQRLNLTTVAEGIETREQLDFLQRHGCRLGQGYLFAKPMKASDVPKYLSKTI